MDKATLALIAKSVGKKALDWAETPEGKEFLYGKYTDGTPRSFADMWNDEIYSPKSRQKRVKELEKRQKRLYDMMYGKPKKKKKSKKKKAKKKASYWKDW